MSSPQRYISGTLECALKSGKNMLYNQEGNIEIKKKSILVFIVNSRFGILLGIQSLVSRMFAKFHTLLF